MQHSKTSYPGGIKKILKKMFIFIVKYDTKGVVLWLQTLNMVGDCRFN